MKGLYYKLLKITVIWVSRVYFNGDSSVISSLKLPIHKSKFRHNRGNSCLDLPEYRTEVPNMAGFINNDDAKLILDFLEKQGPAPYDALLALAILQGWNRDGKKVRAMHRLALALKRLAASKCAYRLELDGKEFWFPDGYVKDNGHIDPAMQDAIVWQAVRQEELDARRQELIALLSEKLLEDGACLESGEAIIDGTRYPVRFNLQKEVYYFGDKLYCHLSDLRDRKKSFKNCLQPLDAGVC
jgi:hypothetical protein